MTTSGVIVETPIRSAQPYPFPTADESQRKGVGSGLPVPHSRTRRRSTISSAAVPVLTSTTPTNVAEWDPKSLPAPAVYDLQDVENLPSPFLKRALDAVKPGWNSLGRRKSNGGNGLLALAAANVANGVGAAVNAKTTGSIGKGSRPSFGRAMKASEDAKRALLRRNGTS